MDSQFVAFLVAITLLTLSPGVDTLLVLRNTSRGGWADGMVSSFGICSALFIHATVSAVGISMVLLHSAWLFSGLKLLGAGYLVWLGVQSLRGLGSLREMPKLQLVGSFRWQRSLGEGLLSNLLNPKAVIFYMAFLPQFIDPADSALQQSLWLAAIHFTIGMIWLGLIAFILDRAKRSAMGVSLQRWIQGLTGFVMIGFGLKLAIDQE